MSLASHPIRDDRYDTSADAYAADRYSSGLKDTSTSSYSSPMMPSSTNLDAGLGATTTYSAMPTMGKEYITTEPGLGQRVPAAARDVRDTARWTWSSLKDTAYSFASPVWSLVAPVWNAGYAALSWALGLAGQYWRSLPAVRAFVYSFGALTLIPNAMFLGFVGVAAAVVLGTALTISSFILAGVAGFGLLFLGPILFFSFWGALIGVGVWQLAMYGLRASAVSLGAAQQMTSGPSGTGIVGSALGMAKSAAAVSADMLEKVEAVAVGGDGLPVPISGRV